jgi:hypothetical protein
MNFPPNPTNWRPLIELIPAIERTRQFGAYPEPVQLAENLSVFSGLSNAAIAGEFMHRAYDNGLITTSTGCAGKPGNRSCNTGPDLI